MTEPRGLVRARADIEAGRIWKARDRLHGLVVGSAGDQAVLDLLGEVLWTMGDLPAAGRYWFLTDRDGDDVRAAVAAMHEHYGPHPGVLRRALPVKAPLESYPAIVQARIREVEHAIPRHHRASMRGSLLTTAARRPRPTWFGLIMAIVIGIWFVGAATVVVLLVDALR